MTETAWVWRRLLNHTDGEKEECNVSWQWNECSSRYVHVSLPDLSASPTQTVLYTSEIPSYTEQNRRTYVKNSPVKQKQLQLQQT